MSSIIGGESPYGAVHNRVYLQYIATLYPLDAPTAPEVQTPVAPAVYSISPAGGDGLLPYSHNAGVQVPVPPFSDAAHYVSTTDGTLWIGGGQGVARLKGGAWRYYAGRRWLPCDTVTGLALDAEERLLVSTPLGTAVIEAAPMTLERKADHYERITLDRHNRDGFVAVCALSTPGDISTYIHEATDNDGLWTALYVCAECFRWATTRDESAREMARRGMNALLSLVRVTNIPGFPARAMIRQGERVLQSDPGPNWYRSPAEPGTWYKNDTSSDEIDGHYLAWYWYFELACNEEERSEIAAVCRAVTDHILKHGYTLVGPTGKPTSWGVWSPERLNGDPEWRAERGLNSLEILSHLKVAAHICAEPRYEAEYRRLINEHGYAANTVRQKMLPPEADNNHSDDELAACAYYPLLLLERDPDLRAIYLESLERTHAVLRPEGSPFYNALYSACTGKSFDADAAMDWFRDAPWDLRDWRMRNSHRTDVTLAAEPDRFGQAQLTRVLPPGERRVTKWNSNPYAADGGTDGDTEEDGAFWLLPYWMCRYHGLL